MSLDIISDTVCLISSDNKIFSVNKEACKISNFIKDVLENDNETENINLNINGEYLDYIVKFIKMYHEEPYDYKTYDHPLGIFLSGDHDVSYCLPQKYAEFSNFSGKTKDFVFNMLNEVGTLHIEPLEHTLVVQISSWFKNKSEKEIEEIFSNVTKEEHARLREEATVEANAEIESKREKI